MADAVFTACFLNELNRNCDIVGMANFAPVVNTRGCIYTVSYTHLLIIWITIRMIRRTAEMKSRCIMMLIME